MSENKTAQIDKELEISIPLENFSYSGAENDQCAQSGLSKFFGRAKEKSRLLDHLKKGKRRGGSFLVAGYRGAGKTRFVSEVLCEYEKESGKFIEVRVNLGNDGDLTSKSVLFNMVYLLNNALRTRKQVRFLRFLFANIIRSLSLAIVFLLALFALVLIFPELGIYKSNFISLLSTGWGTVLSFLCIPMWVLTHNGDLPYPKTWKAFIKLKKLQQKIYSTIDNHAEIKSNFFGFAKRKINGPLTTNQIEVQLKDILKIIKDKDVIFIFDELDKLSGRASDKTDVNLDLAKESKLRKQQVDSILGDLKNLITDSNARYIFIAGRDMYDAYLSERGSSNSLYESLFHDHIYIPSLLTDRSNGEIYLLDSMIESYVVSNLLSREWINSILSKQNSDTKKSKEYFRRQDLSILKLSDYVECEKEGLRIRIVKQKIKEKKQLIVKEINQEIDKILIERIYFLKALIHFLTLHSWGNCKRLFTLFESFVRKVKGQYELYFSTRDIQRLILASQLYILFHHNLSRILMNADDKLVVSSFSIFHYILKYHGVGFSREHILRMYETINIHSSPDLNRIVDIIIHNVLLNHVRRVRNNFYQYRFTFLHEKEIHFITTINDGESAAFNFSLNAMDAVKQHYKNLIIESKHTHAEERYGHITLVSIHVIVGNFHLWEQAFDEASIHYGIALDILGKNGGMSNDPDKIDLNIQMVELFLKLGAVDEKVGNYTAAATAYLSAERLANKCLELLNSKRMQRDFKTGIENENDPEWDIHSGDPKWDVLRQARWARLFLNLKKGTIVNRNQEKDLHPVSEYKEAVYLFFMEKLGKARSAFIKVALSKSTEANRYSHESTCFLKGNAYLKAGFSLFLEWSDELHQALKKEDSLSEAESTAEKLKPLIDKFNDFIGKASNGPQEISLLVDDISALEDVIKPDTFKVEVTEPGVLARIIQLLNLSALSFQQGKLNFNAAMSYLCMVMIWQAFHELIPWKKNDDKSWEGISKFEDIDTEKSDKQWISQAQKLAFDHFGFNTGEAYHHFMRSVLERNMRIPEIDTESYFGIRSQRDRILGNKDLLFQHFSLFVQVVVASIYWEQMSVNFMGKKIPENDKLILLEGTENQLLPYGIRHYSLMLWLKGRKYLGDLLRSDNKKTIQPEVIAANAIVNLFRSSQYVIKTHGETSHMILPALFMIYYNMWEVLFHLVKQESRELSFEQAVYRVRFRLTEHLKKDDIKDISSRVLDLESVERMAQEQFKITERMNDLSSVGRTSVLKNKYYLDDDYEDNMFILDWSYCRFFAPGAIMHRKIMEYRMNWLKRQFGYQANK